MKEKINKDLPKLFCEVGESISLKKRIQFESAGKTIIFEVGTIFKVINIVGYGFDLIPKNHSYSDSIRLLNSEMPNYFAISP